MIDTNHTAYAANVYSTKMNTARAVCRLMQLHSPGGVLGSKISTPYIVSPVGLNGAERPHVGLCPTFLVRF